MSLPPPSLVLAIGDDEHAAPNVDEDWRTVWCATQRGAYTENDMQAHVLVAAIKHMSCKAVAAALREAASLLDEAEQQDKPFVDQWSA